jgi:hypothetical protein
MWEAGCAEEGEAFGDMRWSDWEERWWFGDE